jgi:hypothetical protein
VKRKEAREIHDKTFLTRGGLFVGVGGGWGGLGFGEKSPEAKAAEALHNFFTYVAVKIVASQLQVWPFPAANLTQREGGESTKQNAFRDKSLHHPIVGMSVQRGGKMPRRLH